jgi:hypothetical protein
MKKFCFFHCGIQCSKDFFIFGLKYFHENKFFSKMLLTHESGAQEDQFDGIKRRPKISWYYPFKQCMCLQIQLYITLGAVTDYPAGVNDTVESKFYPQLTPLFKIVPHRPCLASCTVAWISLDYSFMVHIRKVAIPTFKDQLSGVKTTPLSRKSQLYEI